MFDIYWLEIIKAAGTECCSVGTGGIHSSASNVGFVIYSPQEIFNFNSTEVIRLPHNHMHESDTPRKTLTPLCICQKKKKKKKTTTQY